MTASRCPLNVGDILVSRGGYDETNYSWYQVIATTNASVRIREIAEENISEVLHSTSTMVVPIKDRFVGPERLRRVRIDAGGPWVGGVDHNVAFRWDGKPVLKTRWGHGH